MKIQSLLTCLVLLPVFLLVKGQTVLEDACDRMLAQGGIAYQQYMGVYRKQETMVDGLPAYKHEENDMFCFHYSWWDEFDFGLNADINDENFGYIGRCEEEPYPYIAQADHCSFGNKWRISEDVACDTCWGVHEYFKLDCLDTLKDRMNYKEMRPGVCEDDLIDGATISNPSGYIAMEDCFLRCDAEPRCKGFSNSRQGCNVYSRVCAETTMVDGYGFDFYFGLVSEEAINHTAWQSTTFLWQGFGEAELSVDGDFTPFFPAGSCSSTRRETNPWWAVDLGSERHIVSVAISNRLNSNVQRVSNFLQYVVVGGMTVDPNAPDIFDIGPIVTALANYDFTYPYLFRCGRAGETTGIRTIHVACDYETPARVAIVYFPDDTPGNNIHVVTMCEFQPTTKSAASYIHVKERKTLADARTFCQDVINGELMKTPTEAAYVATGGFLENHFGSGAQPAETYVWLDHTQAEIDNNQVYNAQMSPDAIRDRTELTNVALLHVSPMPCEHSTAAPIGEILGCDKAMNLDVNDLGWLSQQEGVGSWVKYNFQSPYNVYFVSVLPQNPEEQRFTLVEVEFDDLSTREIRVVDSTDNKWYGVVVGGIRTSYVKLTLTETITATSSNGFREVSIQVDSDKYFMAVPGFCTTTPTSTFTGTLVDCEASCRNDATCTGFNYWFTVESCDQLAGPICEGATVTFDSDATYFILGNEEDVAAFAPVTGLVDVAHGAQTRQGPNSPDNGLDRSGSAVDGVWDTTYSSSSCTHTLQLWQPWWAVEFDAPYKIERVLLLNRGDCCADRLHDIQVVGLDERPAIGAEFDSTGVPDFCAYHGPTVGASETLRMECDPALVAKPVLMVQLVSTTDTLTLCQVSAYATKPNSIMPTGPVTFGTVQCSAGLLDSVTTLSMAECIQYCENHFDCDHVDVTFDATIGREYFVCQLRDSCGSHPTALPATPGMQTLHLKRDKTRYGDYIILGCFDRNQDIFGDQLTISRMANTVDGCADLCSARGYNFIAVEVSWCHCGNTVVGVSVAEANCLSPCRGDLSQQCGGDTFEAATVFIINSGAVDTSCFISYRKDHLVQVHTHELCDAEHEFVCKRGYHPCASVPCQNGGSCSANNELTLFTCQCVIGFTGLLCETNIDDCEPFPCFVDRAIVCNDLVNSFSCECDPGYDQPDCAAETDECASNPCQHGSSCTDELDQYICDCTAGYTGTNCETDIDECAARPCLNNGFCTAETPGTYTCDCISGFTGDRCEINFDECASDPCENNSTCVDRVDDYMCECIPGFYGQNCEIELLECASFPCQNDATCLDLNDMYECLCVEGFVGVNCEIDVDECSPNPCQNFATCRNLPGTYRCDCHSGYTGDLCEINVGVTGIAGNWTAWSDWPACSRTCGAGFRRRTRVCIPDVPDVGPGDCTGVDPLTDSETDEDYCPDNPECPPMDGGWTMWSPVPGPEGECPQGCRRFRTRKMIRYCANPRPHNGGANCTGVDESEQVCLNEQCPHAPHCSEWSEKTECDSTAGCGAGTSHSARKCWYDAADKETGFVPTWKNYTDWLATRGNSGNSNTNSNSNTNNNNNNAGSNSTATTTTSTTTAQPAATTTAEPEAAETFVYQKREYDCEMPEACAGQADSCHICEQMYTATSLDTQGCSSTGSQCAGGFQGNCFYEYRYESDKYTLEKGCADAAFCETARENRIQNSACRRLHSLASGSYSTEAGSEFSVVPDDLISAMRNLNASCQICCTGSQCNSGFLPNLEEEQTVWSGVARVTTATHGFLIVLMTSYVAMTSFMDA